MNREDLPPPGVSTVGEGNDHTPVATKPSRGRPRKMSTVPKGSPRRAPGEDVLGANIEKGRVIASETSAPTGVTTRPNDIVEMPMPKTMRSVRHTASFLSVDGNRYSFRTHDTRGKALAQRNEMAIFLCLVEISKGGSPIPVLEAFKLKITDIDGKPFFPIPPEVAKTLSVKLPEQDAEDDEDVGFSLGT